MIANDTELQATQERIAFFYRTLANIHGQARSAEEYQRYSNSYLAELEKMQAEVLDYFRRHGKVALPAAAA